MIARMLPSTVCEFNSAAIAAASRSTDFDGIGCPDDEQATALDTTPHNATATARRPQNPLSPLRIQELSYRAVGTARTNSLWTCPFPPELVSKAQTTPDERKSDDVNRNQARHRPPYRQDHSTLLIRRTPHALTRRGTYFMPKSTAASAHRHERARAAADVGAPMNAKRLGGRPSSIRAGRVGAVRSVQWTGPRRQPRRGQRA